MVEIQGIMLCALRGWRQSKSFAKIYLVIRNIHACRLIRHSNTALIFSLLGFYYKLNEFLIILQIHLHTSSIYNLINFIIKFCSIN
jgi:hypothetical protein